MVGGAGEAAGDDGHLFGEVGVLDHDLHQEAVDLGFGEGVGAVGLDRVLGGQDQERGRDGPGLFADGDLVFLHDLEQGGLDFGGGAVDLIGEQEVAEHRAEFGFEAALVGSPDPGPDQIGGDQVGGELDPLEAAAQDLGQGGDGPGLGQPGHPFQQQMATRQQRDQDPFQHAFLADNDPLDLKQRRLELLAGDGGFADRGQAGWLLGHLAGSSGEGVGHSERGRFFHLSGPCEIRHYPGPLRGPPRPRGRSGLRPRPTMQASGVAAAAGGRLASRLPAPVRREGLGCTWRP